jgi:hypothetical protein
MVASDTLVRFIIVASLMPIADPEFDTRMAYSPQHVPCPHGSAPLNGVRVVHDSNLNPVVFLSVPFKENPLPLPPPLLPPDTGAFRNRSDLRFNTDSDMFDCSCLFI